LYEKERRYFRVKIEGVPFDRMRFSRYKVDEIAILKAKIHQRPSN
jgi:hypothetical protein